jgi:hypothetical protein
MYPIEEAHDLLDRWFDEGCVGNIYFYRAPTNNEVDCFLEQTVKLREMNVGEKKDLDRAFSHWRFERAEVFHDKDYNLDRVKFIRRY